MRSKQTLIAVVILLFGLATPAYALFTQPTYLPVERLTANTQAHLQKDPNDDSLWYNLARIHYLAFSNQTMVVGAYDSTSPPLICPVWHIHEARQQHALQRVLEEQGFSSINDVAYSQRSAIWEAAHKLEETLEKQGWRPPTPSPEQMLGHATEAQRCFKKAIDLKPDKGLYLLGLASLYRQYLQYSTRMSVPTPARGFEHLTAADTRDVFYEAFCASIDKDMDSDSRPTGGVSYEAGFAFIELAKTQNALSREIKRKIAKVRDALSKLDMKATFNIVTPIIFSFRPHTRWQTLLAPALEVQYDLDGDGSSELWPWVASDTGLLVWDPFGSGCITSGRQLFGTATWWILFSNGYCALDALDNNRDGQLTAGELKGISAWFDRNSNGISECAEVIDVQRLGILSISTQYTEDDDVPHNPAGMVLQNGRVIPTYDWITSPVTGR